MREHIHKALKAVTLPESLNVQEVHPALSKAVNEVDIRVSEVAKPKFLETGDITLEHSDESGVSSGNADKSDPLKATLHPDAEIAYDQSNSAYIASADNVYDYIQINSAVRSTKHQYDLYRKFVEYKFFGGDTASAANQPGTSNHEYGLAIDIIYRKDETLLTTCLEANGWKKHSNTSEPWHFDASEISNYSEIQDKIAQVKKMHSSKIVDSLFKRLKAEKTLEQELPAYEATKKHLNKRSNDLGKFRTHLTVKRDTLQDRKEKLVSKASTFRVELDSLAELKKNISDFRYSYCPNGKAYNRCTHANEKQRYTSERNKIINRYNKHSIRLKKLRVDLVEEKASLASAVKAFNQENSRFKYETERLKKDIANLEIVTDRLDKFRKLIEDFEEGINNKLQMLSAQVSKVRQESQ